MSSWKPTVAFVLVGGMALVGVFFAAGCNLDDLVKASVPLRVQQVRQLPPRISLGAARDEYESLFADNRRMEAAFRESIQGSEMWRDFIGGMLMQGIELGGGFLGPVAPIAMPALFGAAGLLIRRPGDVTNKEKEKAYNKGLSVGANGLSGK